MKDIKLNEKEQRVLAILVEECEEEGRCMYFRGIVSRTEEKLDLAAVRRACRSLARKGLAEYHRGLFDEDGMVAGSGYSPSTAGIDFIHSLQGPEQPALL